MSGKRAIIDIGSNTVRLVIYGGPLRAPEVLLNEKVTARLGRDVAANGLLSAKAMTVALDALRRYAALLDVTGVSDVQCVATAAVRDAANGPQFLHEVEVLGLAPRLMSGGDEARTSALGVIAAFPGARGIAGDLGGGSLELTRIADGTSQDGISLPLGTLRLADMRAGGEKAFAAQVRGMLADAGWRHGRDERFHIVGGSWRALALYSMHLQATQLDDPHDFELSATSATSICAALAADGPTLTVPRISASRMATLPHAAALLHALIGAIKPAHIVFSSWGLREGLLYAALTEAERAEDPTVAGIAAFVKRYDIALETARAIVLWLGDTVPGTSEIKPGLRLAATMLALASARVEPNVRSSEALDWALRKRWIGMSASDRALVAIAVLANNGQTAFPQDLRGLVSGDEAEWAVRWGLAIRFARKLTNASTLALGRCALGAGEGRLVLTLDDLTGRLFSAQVAKSLDRLADRLALEPETRHPDSA